MTVAEICIVVFGGIGTLLIAIPAVYMGVDYFQERRKKNEKQRSICKGIDRVLFG